MAAAACDASRTVPPGREFLMLNRLAVLPGLGLLALIALAVSSTPALGKLNAQDAFNDPGSQSTRAQTQIQNATGHDAYPEVVALVKTPSRDGSQTLLPAVLRAGAGRTVTFSAVTVAVAMVL
jgi:hypothetical protein